MPNHTLYAYVEGADLHEVEKAIERGWVERIAKRQWLCGTPRLVNQRHSAHGLKAGDWPLWDLGVNLDLPDIGKEPAGWFADVEEIATIAGELHSLSGRDFVIGIAEQRTSQTEDLFTVDTPTPDLDELRKIIGVGPAY